MEMSRKVSSGAIASFPPLLSRDQGISSPFPNCHFHVKLVLIAPALCGRLGPYYVERWLWTVFWFVTGLR